MHATLQKFGYPGSLIREFDHWCVVFRPQQSTLGALVLAAKDEAAAFSALKSDAFKELATVTRTIETALKNTLDYGKINYLMLMMVDPHVHFHVLPRYAGPQTRHGTAFTDPGWPGPPDLKHTNTMSDEGRAAFLTELRAAFAKC